MTLPGYRAPRLQLASPRSPARTSLSTGVRPLRWATIRSRSLGRNVTVEAILWCFPALSLQFSLDRRENLRSCRTADKTVRCPR